MTKEIVSVGYEIPGFSDKEHEYDSRSSLMDADILLFCPCEPSGRYETYQGKYSYDDSGSFKYKESSAYWSKEIMDFLKSGKTVFLFLGKMQTFFLRTGTSDLKGKVTINHVREHNSYEFLPTRLGNINSANGKVVEFLDNPIFAPFYKEFGSQLEYKIYLDNLPEGGTAIFSGKDPSKVLGAKFKIGKGNLVLLPYLPYERSKFTTVKSTKKGDQLIWNAKGLKFGSKLISLFDQIDNDLKGSKEKSPPPEWALVDEYKSEKEVEIANEINEKNKEVSSLNDDILKLQDQLLEEQILAGLLFEKGKDLELSVIKALSLLGFSAENYNDGELELDQVITSPEGIRYIGECEGKDTKPIDIDKLRQLIESMNADFYREGVTEKAFGILFANPERLKKPSERTLDFTDKCKKSADREKIALIKTEDLFVVCRYLSKSTNEEFKKLCRKAIHDGLGKVVIFPKIPVK